MGIRSLVAVSLAFGLVRTAHADPKGDIQKKAKEAMESYDLMDYDAAKKTLEGALAQAKRGHLDKDPVTARVYIDLGIADFAAADQDGAKTAFAAAVKIDPKVQIDAAYKSPELQKLLDSVRGSAGPSSGGGEPDLGPADSGVDCKSIHGLQHEILDTGKRGVPQPIEATLGGDVKAAHVSVMFRPEGATEFTEAKLSAAGCQYKGNIPASAMKGELVHYYVAAYDGSGKVIASKGSAGSPNILELTGNAPKGGAVTTGDEEDPLGKHGGAAPKPKQVSQEGTVSQTDGGDVGVTVEGPAKKKHVLIAVTGGTGFGYVTGKTEGMSEVQNCCIGSSPVVVTPEIGFFVNRKMSISVAARLGFPLGANVDGHATLAPAALLRLRYAFSESGDGLRFMGQIGGGVLRNTIKLDNSMMGMDTDIVAQGPLLIGAGLGYAKHIGGSVSFIADLSVLGAIAVTDHLGSAILNNGIGADLSIGLAFGI